MSSKNYYYQNRDKIIEKQRLYKLKLREELFQLKLKYGGMCIKCGYCEEPKILHFHHLKDKIIGIANYSRKKELVKKEIEKCILLCPNCHALKHLYENEKEQINTMVL